MTENRIGKGLSFAKRIYLPRIVGLAIGLLSVLAAIYPLDLPGWVWALLFFNGLAWPHLAYRLSSRAREPYQAERRNLIYDSLLGGFWAATMQFNPLPTVTILSMMAMNNVAAGGHRLLVQGLLAQGTGMLVSITLLGPGLELNATPLQIYACLPMLTLYPLAVGSVCYGLAIKLSEHKRTLRALSLTDSLTGLLNHGSWKDLLHLKFHKCRQERCEAVIAVIDIDHFKQINDSYGHIVGDCVLRQLSAELKRNLRENDLAGRYGGDEFCVILPYSTLSQAIEIMERLRQSISNYRNEQLPELRVSLSIGLASCRNEFADPAAWLNEADKALYAAKNSGRDKVNFAPADPVRFAVAYPE
ncbi:diguanylate cyclase [Pseudomonas sp. LS1212]|uniref:diguanylate cyclase n=1 Tax=Pseudomonas sp. LS1212 TaxID=2972478 RepID=UPI00215B7940|nr:diguanylate cyclase [Pseudomonas sp. LS1212]UVJ42974.1 diguanylate cyclase [Pseudomonas sp. LS1212]